MKSAGVSCSWCVPKGLRHGLAVEAVTQANVPLNMLQRWLGHSRLETTAIYLDAIGPEERKLAHLMWFPLAEETTNIGNAAVDTHVAQIDS